MTSPTKHAAAVDPLTAWEDEAEQFYKDTGYMRPGKDDIRGFHTPNERSAAFQVWLKMRRAKEAAEAEAKLHKTLAADQNDQCQMLGRMLSDAEKAKEAAEAERDRLQADKELVAEAMNDLADVYGLPQEWVHDDMIHAAEQTHMERDKYRKALEAMAEGCSFPEDDVQRAIRDRARKALADPQPRGQTNV